MSPATANHWGPRGGLGDEAGIVWWVMGGCRVVRVVHLDGRPATFQPPWKCWLPLHLNQRGAVALTRATRVGWVGEPADGGDGLPFGPIVDLDEPLDCLQLCIRIALVAAADHKVRGAIH